MITIGIDPGREGGMAALEGEQILLAVKFKDGLPEEFAPCKLWDELIRARAEILGQMWIGIDNAEKINRIRSIVDFAIERADWRDAEVARYKH